MYKEIIVERVDDCPNLEAMNAKARSDYLRMKNEHERNQKAYIEYLERQLRAREKIVSVDIEIQRGKIVLAAPNGWRRRIS